ncbi:MAG: 3-methyl-2-oxobutanoate dehydrogenase subunit VorB [Candidatus Electryonea clarkiae]|nr:3-methyl-2-oxobutanoate dehydrogenase subunit VorB [Candidatus Electryonea clarkiae]MDP8286867.1 3-methyl-2-oxobutanoate dehydrogenase subunit VorB [Candidatus Electryonea clarkiae]
MAKKLMKGNEAIGEAAIQAGAMHYFAYPITPQTEVAEYLARRMPEVGGVFLQAESELGASNMLFGAAASGKRAFTTSSSPGISLMSEAISYITCAELPCVLVNVCRAGPGLGGILPSQGDYFQATKGGGHGDYRLLVLAPSTVQEAVEHIMQAFDLADKYRNPVMIFADGLIGQMMEPVDFSTIKKGKPADHSSWAATGAKGREPHIIKTLYLQAEENEKHNIHLANKYKKMDIEKKSEIYGGLGKPELILAAFGTSARVCKTAIDQLNEEGIDIALFRPITLYPFDDVTISELANKKHVKQILTIEMNSGQMIEDIRLFTKSIKPIHFFGRQGGIVPSPEEVIAEIRKIIRN